MAASVRAPVRSINSDLGRAHDAAQGHWTRSLRHVQNDARSELPSATPGLAPQGAMEMR